MKLFLVSGSFAVACAAVVIVGLRWYRNGDMVEWFFIGMIALISGGAAVGVPFLECWLENLETNQLRAPLLEARGQQPLGKGVIRSRPIPLDATHGVALLEFESGGRRTCMVPIGSRVGETLVGKHILYLQEGRTTNAVNLAEKIPPKLAVPQ